MPIMEVDLNQVLKVLEQLSPQERVLVRERLAAQQATEKVCLSTDVFSLSFDDYLALSDEEREPIQLRAYQAHQTWIDMELEQRGAEWLIVCGGEIFESSSTLRDYPSREKLMRIGKQRRRVPFVFVRESLVEESGWSALEDNDCYPTVRLTIAALSTGMENLLAAGI